MNAPMRKVWTQEEFLRWVAAQEGRWEFDGFEPVAMTGGSANHNLISGNAYVALRRRLQGTCRAFFEMGVETVGTAVRFPDILVTCSAFDGNTVKMPDPVLVMEIISPDSGRRDRIEKLREYGAVPSIRYYIIVESSGVGLTLLTRSRDQWVAATLADDDVLNLSEIEVEIPVTEFYEGIDFDQSRMF